MTAKHQDEKRPEQDQGGRERRKVLIGEYVLHGLGHPADLQRVLVRWLWDEHYRVNVLVGSDVASARVAHSFFLMADGEGKILACSPKVTKHY